MQLGKNATSREKLLVFLFDLKHNVINTATKQASQITQYRDEVPRCEINSWGK